jgi:hypothetical protein
MQFDYTEYEYLPECSDGCGALTDWLPSNDAAYDVGLSHEKQTGHRWRVQQRMIEPQPGAQEAPQGEQKLRKE